MIKVTKPHVADDKNYIFTEGINYFETEQASIWGQEDQETKAILDKVVKPTSRWLNLGAGDGRYNTFILSKSLSVTSQDIDLGALSKLWHNTPINLRDKLSIIESNIADPLPLPSSSFDGVFCAGLLHLFPKKIVKNILGEISRVLKIDGSLIINLAANIERKGKDGKLVIFGDEPLYSVEGTKQLYQELLPNFNVNFHTGKIIQEDVQDANPPHLFKCELVIVEAIKINNV
jgi:ubiquinone/menaquinone biosynthesis C-methylase UbiE